MYRIAWFGPEVGVAWKWMGWSEWDGEEERGFGSLFYRIEASMGLNKNITTTTMVPPTVPQSITTKTKSTIENYILKSTMLKIPKSLDNKASP